ncbi:Uncharacterised protein [Mycobacteroides abscessus subsp. abscessus]|nr:Uncharacterised protein [Mycobacteroides abscessus subsp. abscessus]
MTQLASTASSASGPTPAVSMVRPRTAKVTTRSGACRRWVSRTACCTTSTASSVPGYPHVTRLTVPALDPR